MPVWAWVALTLLSDTIIWSLVLMRQRRRMEMLEHELELARRISMVTGMARPGTSNVTGLGSPSGVE